MFWISFLIFYFSYLFRVIFLVFLVLVIILVYIASMIYLKYLVILIYVRGIVIFILYISCICWYINQNFIKLIIFFRVFVIYFYDRGIVRKFTDVGEFLWIYLFFRFLFNSLVISYSLNLFKVSGSLRF